MDGRVRLGGHPHHGWQRGAFVITGPGWSGTLPDGVQQLRSPTAMVWLLGHTQTPTARPRVRQVQPQGPDGQIQQTTPLNELRQALFAAVGVPKPPRITVIHPRLS